MAAVDSLFYSSLSAWVVSDNRAGHDVYPGMLDEPVNYSNYYWMFSNDSNWKKMNCFSSLSRLYDLLIWPNSWTVKVAMACTTVNWDPNRSGSRHS